MKLVFTRTLALSSIVLLAASCGKPKAVAPESTKLNLPEFSSGSNFRLTDSTEEQEFNGALVLWDKNLTSDKLVPLLQATRVYNESYTDYAKTLTDVIDNQLFPSNKIMLEKKEILEKLTVENSQKQLDVALLAAANWFDNELKAKAEAFPGIDVVQAKAVFARYCDAKVIELASSNIFNQSQYSKRPTPAAICENYYAGRLFDVSNPECAPAPQGEFKNYAACFWRHGVLKTSYFVGSKKVVTDVQVNELVQLVSEPDFMKSLEVRNGSDIVPCKRLNYQKYVDIPLNAKSKDINRNDFMSLIKLTQGAMDKATVLIDNVNVEVQYLKEFKLKCGNLVGSFFYKPIVLPPLDALLSSALVNKIEQPNSDESDVYELIGKKSIDGTDALPQVNEFRQQLKKQLSGLSQLNQNCTYPLGGGSDKIETAQASVNELRFNGPLRSQPISCPDADKAILPDVFGTVNAELEAARVEFQNSSVNFETSKASVCTSQLDNCDESKQSPVQFKECNSNKLMNSKILAVAVPGVAAAAVKMRILSKPLGAEGVKLTLFLNASEVGSVCIDSYASGKKIDCPDVASGNKNDELHVSFNPINSNLTLSKVLSDLKAFEKDNTVNVSNEVANEILGKTLKIELYPNSFDGFVPYLSGKALVLDGDKEIYQGAASYLINEKKFVDKKNRICN